MLTDHAVAKLSELIYAYIAASTAVHGRRKFFLIGTFYQRAVLTHFIMQHHYQTTGGPNMLTTEEANKLRTLIADYRDAAIDESWKGAGDPTDKSEIERAERDAKVNLEQYIHELEHGPSNVTPIRPLKS